MNEAEFFYNNYPTAKEKLSYEDCLRMTKVYGVFFIPNKFIALYININDKYMDLIETDNNLAKKESFLRECLLNVGNNVHFIFCVGNGMNNILKCIKEVSIRESAKTISWCRNGSDRISIRRLLWI